MNKKQFEEVVIEVIITNEDIIKTSGEDSFEELWGN